MLVVANVEKSVYGSACRWRSSPWGYCMYGENLLLFLITRQLTYAELRIGPMILRSLGFNRDHLTCRWLLGWVQPSLRSTNTLKLLATPEDMSVDLQDLAPLYLYMTSFTVTRDGGGCALVQSMPSQVLSGQSVLPHQN